MCYNNLSILPRHHRLWGMRCYLIGAMDRAADMGVGWRRRLIPYLEGLGLVTLDPTNKPIDIGSESDMDRQRRIRLKNAGDYDKLAEEIHLLRVIDLRMVDMSDFLIFNLDTSIHACGSYEEMGWANRLKNPILIHCEQGKDHCPDWLFGMIPHEHIFSTWTEMYKYLWHVHTADEVDHMNRWMFFDYTQMVPKIAPILSNVASANLDTMRITLDGDKECLF